MIYYILPRIKMPPFFNSAFYDQFSPSRERKILSIAEFLHGVSVLTTRSTENDLRRKGNFIHNLSHPFFSHLTTDRTIKSVLSIEANMREDQEIILINLESRSNRAKTPRLAITYSPSIPIELSVMSLVKNINSSAIEINTSYKCDYGRLYDVDFSYINLQFKLNSDNEKEVCKLINVYHLSNCLRKLIGGM